jgi:hypothetical protein
MVIVLANAGPPRTTLREQSFQKRLAVRFLHCRLFLTLYSFRMRGATGIEQASDLDAMSMSRKPTAMLDVDVAGRFWLTGSTRKTRSRAWTATSAIGGKAAVALTWAGGLSLTLFRHSVLETAATQMDIEPRFARRQIRAVITSCSHYRRWPRTWGRQCDDAIS